MCGIAGCLQRDVPQAQVVDGLNRMLSALAHRGPDDEGLWFDATLGLGLGHRRLSIRDLSVAGHQPMFTDDGEMGLVFNGEIYNAETLRRQLGSQQGWRGHSDTEVLLRAIRTWGLNAALSRAAGMFAIALWDRSRHRLTLVRDRLGIKPLYYSLQDGQLFWASELKALMAHPRYRAEVNPAALQLFLRFGYVPAPHCILKRTWKMMPGRWLEFDVRSPTTPTSHTYWDATEVARHARSGSDDRDDDQLIDQTRTLLSDIIDEHVVSDVPLGAFLSGGIDSSLVVALMQSRSRHPVQTFAIGFHESSFDEAPYARQVAATLGTEHHEHYVSADQVARCVPQWASHYCEPFSDTSSLPSLIVCREARQHVTVALTGDGGDELFAGYRRYQQTLAMQRRIQRCPRAIRRSLQSLLSVPSPAMYNRMQSVQRRFAPSIRDGFAESIRKTRSILATESDRDLYECLASISFNANAANVMAPDALRAPDASVLDEQHPGWNGPASWQDDWELLENMQLWDSRIYLPNDILHKVDIASMSAGLEVRVPLLDHRLYEQAWRIPDRLKVGNGQGKLLLRRLLGEFLPAHEFDRPKRGFSAPLDAWLRGPLREWAEALLEPTSLEASGLLQPATVRSYWDDLMAERAGHARVWPVLVFLAWQQHYLEPATSTHEHRVCNASDDPLRVGGQS